MNATNLYITTCRYVIQSNPHDPESWAELYRYLPYLRQALSCCVCGQVLDHPVGSTNGVCQHQVCKDCLGGKMKYVRPQCSWCKDQKGFEENAQLRIVVQCFKKLCEYLSSTAIATNLIATNNGGTSGNTLMGIIHEGMSIKDCYTPVQGSKLGLFPPKLQKINANIQGNRTGERVDSREATAQGEGRGGTSNLSVPRVVGGKRRGSAASGSSSKTKCGSTSKVYHRRASQHSQASSDPTTPDISSVASSSPDPKLCETVAAEHDYIRNKSRPNDAVKQEPPTTPTKSLSPKHHLSRSPNAKASPPKSPKSPKSAVSKSSRCKKSDLSDLENHSKKRKHSQAHKNEPTRQEKKRTESSSAKNTLDSNSNNNKVTTNANAVANNTKSKSRNQKKGQGCRCGLATPNPGKLTCCGQRCPCYSAFKGCDNCRCRGCRNPRGDPSRIPIYLKQHQGTDQEQCEEQMQEQLLQQQVTQIQHQFIQIQDHSQGESAEESDVEVDI